MNGVNSTMHSAAATAFDGIAESYDEVFTRSLIGQAQRKQVWRKLLEAFPPGSSILELNCGTGEDARFLAKRNRSVVACDASAEMIEVAKRRNLVEGRSSRVEYLQLANEDLGLFSKEELFDGAFSNFSGLNCLADLRPVAMNLAGLIKPGGRVLICLWSRFCVTELIWYALHGQRKKAVRRISGQATAKIGGIEITVSYPTVRAVCGVFSPWFQLQSRCAVGLFVPPSYMEGWARKHQNLLSRMESLDGLSAEWPILRDVGDHVLLEFVRCQA
jgi:ubiquinone/menaquinone biosynthesis C-methylase UbiE